MTDTSSDAPLNNDQQQPKQGAIGLLDLLQVVKDNLRPLFFGSLGTGLLALLIAKLNQKKALVAVLAT